MKGKAEGTYPRRLIRETHTRNPTFHSFHLFDVLHPSDNPELKPLNNAETKDYHPGFYFNKIVPSTINIPKKSLSYLPTNKFQLPQQESPTINSSKVSEKVSKQRSKSTGKLQMDSLSFAQLQFNNKRVNEHIMHLNFRNTKSIKQKQHVNYNIISNLSN